MNIQFIKSKRIRCSPQNYVHIAQLRSSRPPKSIPEKKEQQNIKTPEANHGHARIPGIGKLKGLHVFSLLRNYLNAISCLPFMKCKGGFSLEESKRRTWYNPESLLIGVGLSKGMTFADIGCGEGFFSILAAEIVGECGAVHALDIDAVAINRLKARALEKGLDNIHAVVGAAEDTAMCNQCVDIAFLSMVLHDFDDPEKVLVNARNMLKPQGLLVNLDWKKKQMDFGPPVYVRFSEGKATRLLEQTGFTVEKVQEAGPYHYIIKARL